MAENLGCHTEKKDRLEIAHERFEVLKAAVYYSFSKTSLKTSQVFLAKMR